MICAKLIQTILFPDVHKPEKLPVAGYKRHNEKVIIQFPKICDPLTPILFCGEAETLNSYIYPLNCCRREYQFEIAKQCIEKNTLVCLPTGSGKTLIASVVIMNFHRWFPDSIILFIAPTRALVYQQLDACLEYSTIPENKTCVLTGTERLKGEETDIWERNFIFFATPQIVHNDLNSGKLEPRRISLIILDEAHHARGRHPYSEIIRLTASSNPKFRVVGLTATPGGSLAAVQEVVCNTLASSIAYRSMDDLAAFRHGVETVVEKVEVGDSASSVLTQMKDIIDEVAAPLKERSLIKTKEITRGSIWVSFMAFKKLPKNKKFYEDMERFGILLSLASISEKLARYGPSMFSKAIEDFKNKTKSKNTIIKNSIIPKLENLKFNEESDNDKITPKTERLIEIMDTYTKESNSKAIIFVQFRQAAAEIASALNKRVPNIKAKAFVGKAKDGQSSSEQAALLRDFRNGNINCIVATCVAEEGLDIGDVDLIVCYDTPASPLRTVQRMGRTGRHSAGRVISLVSKGSEERSLYAARSTGKIVESVLRDPKRLALFDPPSKIVPLNLPCVTLRCGLEREPSNSERTWSQIARRKGIELVQRYGRVLKYKPMKIENTGPVLRYRISSSFESRILNQSFDAEAIEELFASDSDSDSETDCKITRLRVPEHNETPVSSPLRHIPTPHPVSLFSDDSEWDCI